MNMFKQMRVSFTLSVILSSGSAMAQEAILSAEEYVAALEALATAVTPPRTLTMQGVGTGTVAPGGSVFVSLSGTTRSQQGVDGLDASVVAGAGLGDATTSFGAQLLVNITSVGGGGKGDAFGDSGTLGLKLGKQLVAGSQPVFGAVSVVGAGWGDAEDEPPKTTLALSTYRSFAISNGETFPLMLTGGIGSHIRDGIDPGGFAGVGIGLTEIMGASMAYDGNYFNAGISLKIPSIDGATLSLSVNDLFDATDAQRLTVSISYSMGNVFGKGWE